MGIGYCNRCKRYDGHDTNCPTVVGEPGEQQLRSRIEQLTARVRELEEENARLKREDFSHERIQNDTLKLQNRVLYEKMIEAQAYAEQLREAFENHSGNYKLSKAECKIINDLLDKPHDTSALDAYVAEKVKGIRGEVERLAEQCRDYAAQGETDQGIIKSDGKEIHYLRNQIATLTRQRDLAVEAIRHCIAAMGSVTDVKKAMDWPQLHNAQMLSLQALDAIKESEAK